ncbi:MBL fold metallo-hydrolase [Flavihumibacter petaseus]|uniref:Metallo-beta-lactamase domain-containing protein n=1 Tax=Flavihumibacter petaseus NBRC 106054 TaxID=1220578 RepID=A0A0E9N3U4_9BACT|nr:MBL fold metallo-hydrolase [Flavihumibacter petaseus]GAO44448.1 hypothetical protein FPE01S_03_04850 [Flavihumibacter petaseus NBRC 106054]
MRFQNIHPTPMLQPGTNRWKILRDFLNKPRDVFPSHPLPHVQQDLRDYEGDHPRITWFGHSSYLIQARGINLLIDPVFSGHASPVPGMVKAFPGANTYGISQMPPIDLVIITHDHYDHLDRKTQLALAAHTKAYVCPLGVGKYLQRWGVPTSKIRELNWWESWNADVSETPLHLTAMPARHFSGRGLVNGKTLWASYLLQFAGAKIYLGGDSGYDNHFVQIGEKAGPIDLAILECGQYNLQWPLIHMLPEEAVQAAIDLQAKWLLPVHWAKFGLAYHAWDEPIRRVTAAAAKRGVSITTPQIGESILLQHHYPQTEWWAQKSA